MKFAADFFNNTMPSDYFKILDDRECKLGAFISHYQEALGGDFTKLNEAHRNFHYYCSVGSLLKDMGYPMPNKLLLKIKKESDIIEEVMSTL